jgi:2-alkyl-3-oxoalkanoate reductase
MQVLVTGGGGFLGTHLVGRLLERGDRVRVLGRSRYPELEKLGVECIQGDVRDRGVLEKATVRTDAVFHIAAKVGYWGKRADYAATNVGGTKNVLEACAKNGVTRVLYTSSPSVVIGMRGALENADERVPYPERHLSDYSATKARAEALVLEANGRNGLVTAAIRPHFIFGPRDPQIVPRLVENANKGTLVRIGDGTNKVDVTYIDNAVNAHLLALDALAKEGSPVRGQAYFIGQERPVLLWEFVDRVLHGFGAKAVSRHISVRTARIAGAIVEGLYRLFGLEKEPPITRSVAVIMGTSHYFSHEKARRDFGYEPTITTEEGLRRLFEHPRPSGPIL